ncbi:type II and III secretion system protein family protein [Alkalilacustris brevis]|uniref:type II and III secretion system protein family protein n=1 Tax=Alkalilacustris brevis TaxID=2026338 RepID=UPI000E0CE47A|nr:type II and III secretion system protein family protein [Alkalilacustris brevis]
MSFSKLLRASIFGFALIAVPAMPVSAETLRILNGAAVSSLNVPMNRAVVVESDQPFAELSIANPNIADISTLSDRSIYVLGKTPGRTTLTILSPDGQLIANVEVQVTPDIAEFKERLRQILPGEDIEVRTANDGIVLSGVVSSSAKLDSALNLANRYAPERVSNLMSVGGSQQVMLKVRFAEMQRSVSKGLGAQFNVSSSNNSLSLGTGLSNPQGTLDLGFTAGSLQFSVLLEALEAKGLVRTLAEPNLTALSGQEAKFLAGGEYPIPVADADGRVTIEYKPFGVELNFTPWVVDGDVVNLAINAAVSSIDTSIEVGAGGFPVNAFRRRETSTTVEMRDGESFAIAGLLQDDFQNTASQVPWLGDIPVLGALFRSTSYQRQQSELVIIVTPHLVTPTRGEALALPTDRVRPPSEREMFLFGQMARGERLDGAAGEVSRQDFGGPYGYVMD